MKTLKRNSHLQTLVEAKANCPQVFTAFGAPYCLHGGGLHNDFT